MTKLPEFRNFNALKMVHQEGRDYERIVTDRPGASAVIIAPHGGRIEPQTDVIAQQVAGEQYSAYSFRSLLPSAQANLHITSSRFDDPLCVELVARHSRVVAIHGWGADGERALIGGLDDDLSAQIVERLRHAGIDAARALSQLSGTDPLNICNRGQTGRGVQLELTMALRRGPARQVLIDAVRQVLSDRDRPRAQRPGERERH